MGQNWWWVVLVAVVVVVALYALWAQTRRVDSEPRPEPGVAAEDAAQTESDTKPRDTAGPAAGDTSPGADEDRAADEDAAAAGSSARAENDVEQPAEPDGRAAAGTESAVPDEGVAVSDAPRREPVDSALAALDSSQADKATTSLGAAAAAVSGAAVRPGPYEGSALAAPDGSAPSPDYPVKANEGSGRYHTSDSPYYVRTRGDLWFRTVEDAQAAGFTAWNADR